MFRNDLPFSVTSTAQLLAAAGGKVSRGIVPVRDEDAPVGSEQFGLFNQDLKEISQLSTVGIKTLSGVSPKNAALEQLGGLLGELPSPEEQVDAIDELLVESDRLFPDQNAHVIARLIEDIVTPDRVQLHDRAYSRIGQRLLRASVRVAPLLTSENHATDSYPLDLLKYNSDLLLKFNEFRLSGGAHAMLEDSGLLEPISEEKYKNWDDSPECLANWIRGEIVQVVQQEIMPDQLGQLMDHTAGLPDDLRGRTLAMLVNTFWNATQNPQNEGMILEIGQMIDELPTRIRITPLEAFYNQLSILPGELSRAFHPMIRRSITRISDTPDFRFNRSKRDLLDNFTAQGKMLEQLNMQPGESLARYQHRMQGRLPPLDH